MEYIIKHSPHMRGKEQKVYDTNGDLMLTISEKITSVSGKEVIYDGSDNIIYLVDTFDRKGSCQSIVYNASSKEILTVYLSRTYQGLNLYISSPDNKFAVNHKNDMSSIQVYRDGDVAATIKSKKTLFGNNYIMDVNPKKDDEFMHLLTMVITKLLEYKAEALMLDTATTN